ncbi:MAG: hypothetical protein ACU0A9_06925 [Alterinioella nitratireducens]|uniref:hypothetical protein n=1 Tax=Alterinioella nitratireducens TaxID=2735915 RepID=UPI00405807A4
MAFSFDTLVSDIRQAAKAPDAEAAIREVLTAVVADPAPLIAATPEDGEDEILYFEDETLSIWRCRFHPHEAIPAHEHKLKVLIAGYAGGETSALYRRGPGGLEHIETVTARAGDVITLDRDAIHTVTTEGGAPSLAIHVYLGPLTALQRDLFDPETGAAVAFTMESFEAMKRPV